MSIIGRFKSDLEFIAWCAAHNLVSAAIALVRDIRASQPSRQVQGASSVRGIYPSQKMGVGIQFESHTNELPTIFEFEYQNRFREYYDQPPKIPVKYFSKKANRNVGYDITPDFFQISDDPGWVECKMEDKLKELAAEMPEMYVQQSDGTWRCPPGEAFATRFGLSFVVRSSASTDWVLHKNLVFLEDYFDCPETVVSKSVAATALEKLRKHPGLTASELLRSVPGITVDILHFLIARFQIYTDLSSALLAEQQKVTLFCNHRIAKAHSLAATSTIIGRNDELLIEPKTGASFLYDSVRYQIIHLGPTAVKLRICDSDMVVDWPLQELETRLEREQLKPCNAIAKSEEETLAFLSTTDPDDLEEATRRQESLGEAHIDPTSCAARGPKLTRTQYRWREKARRALLENKPALMGLVPGHRKKGNRKKRISLRTARVILRVTKRGFETANKPNAFGSWGTICIECDAIGTPAPSYKTYLGILARRDQLDQIRKREGDRVAHNFEPPYWYLHEDTPRHGSRVFEIVHADHTQIDLFTRCRRTGKVLGKGWKTKLTDAFTRRVLAVYVSYRPPNVHSIMMALRICVRRYHRLPQFLVVDNGAEFHSTDFEQLAAWYRVTVKWRPPRKPRFGSIDERLFGSFTTRVLHHQPGNTQAMKRVRTLTASHDPRRLAEWTLEDFVPWMEEFYYEVYDTTSHPALGQSPREAFIQSLSQHGVRQHKFVASYKVFRILTMVTPTQPFVTIQPTTGAHINYNDYWAAEFTEPGVIYSKARAKYDRDDYSVAYIWVKSRWVLARSPHHSVFKRLTEPEVAFYTDELIKERQEHEKKRPITARHIAKFIERMGAALRDLPVMLEAEANRRLSEHFETGAALDQPAIAFASDSGDTPVQEKPPISGGTGSESGNSENGVAKADESVSFVGDWKEPSPA